MIDRTKFTIHRRLGLRFAGAICGILVAALAVQGQVILPEVVDFEASEGYRTSQSLNQMGWASIQGDARLTTGTYFSGKQALLLPASTPPAIIGRNYAPLGGPSVIFFDVYAKPFVGATFAESTAIDAKGAEVGFIRSGEQGQAYVFNGMENGGGTWTALNVFFELDKAGNAKEWMRLTFRQDFAQKVWDLYVGGSLAKFDIGYRKPVSASFGLNLRGSAIADSYFDYLYSGGENPLFADQDKDGMDDAWEVANGLDPTINDRNVGTPSNIFRFQTKNDEIKTTFKYVLTPLQAVAVDPTTLSGLRLLLKADVGTVLDANGKVSTWTDQSAAGKNATQTTAANRPLLVAGQINGLPVVRFTASSNQVLNLSNVMSGATEGDAFIILKTTVNGVTYGVWNWSTPGAGYPLNDGRIQDGFASNNYYTLGKSSQDLTQYHLYNVSGKSGEWIARINGQILHRSLSNGTPSFVATTRIGTGGYNSLTGDVAEVVVFDRVLTESERESVGSYLVQKYALFAIPSAPTSLSAYALSDTQISLSWTSPSSTEGRKFDVERRTGGGGYVVIGTVSGCSFIDGSAVSGITYDYRVMASNYAGASAYSATVSATALTGQPTLFPSSGMRLWLKGDDGAVAGLVPLWRDHSGSDNDATQTVSAQEATLVTNQANGRPVVRFLASAKKFFNLPNLMGTATAGEIFAVLRTVEDAPTGNKGLWRMGPINGGNFTPLAGGNLSEDFGSTAQRLTGTPVFNMSTSFNIYNIAAQTNRWSSRLSGVLQFDTSINTVGFRTDPALGWDTTNTAFDYFDGDIAELIAFNRVLSGAERETVGRYLQSKYALANIAAPATPTGLLARPHSSSQVSLVWSDANPAGVVYSIERDVDGGGYSVLAEVENTLGYMDTGLVATSTYSYRVSARNYAGRSATSAAVAATPFADGADLPLSGMRLWLRGDAGVVHRAGAITTWMDQSGLGNHAIQMTRARQPILTTGVANGRPVVRFAAASQRYLTLPNFMTGATAGEIFAVVKSVDGAPGPNRAFWRLGPLNGASFYPVSGGNLSEDFGSSVQRLTGPPAAGINTSFNAYNISAQANRWVSRMNGVIQHDTNINSVAFRTDPAIGWNSTSGGDYFDGDIAEIIAYNRVLSNLERDSVARYLQSKYGLSATTLPATPTSFKVSAVSSSQASATWLDANPAGVVYTIERQTASGPFVVVANVEGALSYIDTGLIAGTNYTYRVRSRNYSGPSPAYSNLATVVLPTGLTDMPLNGMRMWLRADAGVVSRTTGVASWGDQGGLALNAVQTLSTKQPQWVANAVNGRPSIRFNGTASEIRPPNVTNGLTQSEIFAVLKLTSPIDATSRALWTFGSGSNFYPLNNAAQITERYASTSPHTGGTAPISLTQPHIYNVSATSAGEWTSRLNSLTYLTFTGNTVSFSVTTPTIGGGLAGDIAEIIVYDSALSANARSAVQNYLSQKYDIAVAPPATPTALLASTNAGGQVVVSWSASGSIGGTTFTVERQSGSGAFAAIGFVQGGLNFIDTTASLNTTYNYRVQASNQLGSSGYATQVAITTLSARVIAITADDADADGVRDIEETVLGSSSSVPAVPDSTDILKFRIYTPRP
jgi:hypothetical protein